MRMIFVGKYCVFLFVIIAGVISNAWAGAYVIPVSYVHREVIQKIIAWTEDSGVSNPCYGWNSCYLGPDVMYPTHAPGLGGSCNDSGNCIRIEGLKTREQVLQLWKKTFGVPWTSNEYTVQSEKGTCVGLFYIEKPSYSATDGQKWPGSTCGILPPENLNCTISPSHLELNFGTVNALNLTGRKVGAMLTISCDGDADILLYGQEAGTGFKHISFNNDDSFYSVLDLDGKDIYAGIKLSVQEGKDITKTLNAQMYADGATPKAGDYTGSAIIFISYD